MKSRSFAYDAPDTIEEVVELLGEYGSDATVLAGGQSLLPLLNARRAAPARLVDIGRVEQVRRLEIGESVLEIGSGLSQRVIELDAAVAAVQPLLPLAIASIGTTAIRNRGTVCGSIVQADPTAELPSAAVALDAAIVLLSRRGSRTVAAGDFYRAANMTDRRPDEVVVALRIPAMAPHTEVAFCELAARSHDVALAGAAVVLVRGTAGEVQRCRIVCLGVGPTPSRAWRGEALVLQGGIGPQVLEEVAASLAADLEPPGDIRASAAYRLRVIGVLVRRCLESIRRREAFRGD